MDHAPEKMSRTLWVGVGLLIIILGVAYVLSRVQPRPGGSSAPPVFGKVADFALTNQDGQIVTLADLRGRVWVADIIFTRCAGPCPRMTRQMKLLQDAAGHDEHVPPGEEIEECVAIAAGRPGKEIKRALGLRS